MSAISIVMMIVSMLVLWGGLITAVVLLMLADRGRRRDPGADVRPGEPHLHRDL